MKMKVKYSPNDVNDIDSNCKHELVLDYKNNDICIINDEGDKFSFKQYVNTQTSDCLKDSHLTSSNAHSTVTSKKDGFMSKDDKILLENLKNAYHNINDILNKNIKKSYTINNLKYSVQYSDIINVSLQLKFGTFAFDFCENINLGERPDRYSCNGYRKDGIFITNYNGNIKLTYLKNININDSYVIIDNIKYKYNNEYHYYHYNDQYLIPLLKIKRRNNEMISSDNIFGKISNNLISMSEITDIHRECLESKRTKQLILKRNVDNIIDNKSSNITKIYKTNVNIDKYLDDSVIYCVKFNGTDKDIISNIKLEKNCSYKPSPYGKMMCNAFSKGNIISVHSLYDFTLELFIPTNLNDYADERIITLSDSALNTVLGLSKSEDHLVLSYCDNIYEFEVDKTFQYNTIRVSVSNNLSVYINDNKLIEDPLTESGIINNITIDAITVPLNNVILSKDINFSTNIINKNTRLVDYCYKYSNNTDVEYIEENIRITNDPNVKNNIKYYINNGNSNEIHQGDVIKIYLQDTVDLYDTNTNLTVVDTDGYMITLSNNSQKFNKGDIIKIMNDDYDNYNNVYEIQNVLDDTKIILDKYVKSSKIGYKVFNTNNCVPLSIKICDTDTLKCVKIKNNIITGVFQEHHYLPIDISIKYLTQVNTDTNNVNDIIGVSFDNNIVDIEKKDDIINLNNPPICINNNIYRIEDRDLYYINNGGINAEIRIPVSDFIKSPKHLNEFTDSVFDITMSSGSNPCNINGNIYDRKNVLSNIDNNVCINKNNLANINISTKPGDKKAKLYIRDINYNLKFKDNLKRIYLLERYNMITDYLVLANNGNVYTNTEGELSIIVQEKYDKYTIEDVAMILTEPYKDFCLVLTKNNLIKIMNLSSNKIYRCSKYYVFDNNFGGDE